jgi:hypothetical protein
MFLILTVILLCVGLNFADNVIPGYGLDIKMDMVPAVFFLCDDYRTCYIGYQFASITASVAYVCYMPDESCFLNGIQIDGRFESVGLNSTRDLVNGTQYESTSFAKAFNMQCINLMMNREIDQFCMILTK